jgi:hypothetical protein
MDVKAAIQNGDIAALRRLLAEDSSRANELISWGERKPCFTHPLHFISDMLFQGTLPKGKELPLVDVLLDAGSDVNFQRSREDGKKSDSPLIGAASLGAEALGWAIHGWCEPPAGNHGRHREVVTLLVRAGASVERQWLERDKVRTDPEMLAALGHR